MNIKKFNTIGREEEVNEEIKRFIKDNKKIVYGARSIQAQAGIFSRNTKDWDIYSKKPKNDAEKLQGKLDKGIGFDYYYAKPAKHKGTWKVMNRGLDYRKGTKDDENLADLSKPKGNVKFTLIDGIRYRKLKEEIKAKRKTVADPEFKFRHAKDRDDLNRIRGYIKVRKIMK